MSADNILAAGPRRKAWMRLTEHQRSEAPRLVLNVLSAAVAAQPQAVASVLAEAARMNPRLETHVIWAATAQLGELALTVDPSRMVSVYLTRGVRLRAQQRAIDERQEEGLFS